MNVSRQNKRRVIIALGLGAATVLTLSLAPTPTRINASAPGDVMKLNGKVIDFTEDHPDFNVGSTGHQAWNVNRALGPDGRPMFDGGGAGVASQWYDKSGNPIMPYGDDPGLPGGHFDIDAYDAPKDKSKKHVHEYDDKYDVTYVDLVNDEMLQYQEIIGAGYPNDLRVTFYNQHHGSGTYTFEAGADLQTGNAQDGFDATFSPAELTQLRVDLSALADLRQTSPGSVKSDVVDRDDSFAIRMYDAISGKMVYELAVYHHYKGPKKPPKLEDDRCGDVVDDTEGSFGALNTGGITDEASYDQWYRDILGVNQSARQDISLTQNSDGVFEYLSNDFFPADNRLLGNEGAAHNNNFTFTISATFEYNECTAQFFEFEGNDDAWVYIDHEMVLDLGGTDTPQRQRIWLDRLDLQDGKTYTLDFFFAHRRPAMDSIFRMRTNMWLETTPDFISVAGAFD